MRNYRVLKDIAYPPTVKHRGVVIDEAGRVQRTVGEVIDDLPLDAVAWLIADGAIEEDAHDDVRVG